MLDAQIEKVLAGMLAAPGPPAHEIPIEQARVNHEMETQRLCGRGPDMAEVRELEVPAAGGGVPVRVYRPHASGPLPVVIWMHGGGWAIGTLDTYDTPVRALAEAAEALVVSVGYRLAPEHRFPSAVEDCVAAVRWAAATAEELGGDPSRLAVAGDSAGGNLAAVVARRLRGELDLALQVLIYPVTDSGVSTPSFREFADRFGLTAASMRRFWELYLDGTHGGDPDASPLRATDLAGVAPAHVLLADHDVLRDEGEAYARALQAAGVPVTVREFEGTIHGFFRWLAVCDISRRAVDDVAAALRTALG